VAVALAARLGVPYVELDAVFHQPGWTELPIEDFRARVAEAAAGDAWVVDGNYRAVLDLVWARADTAMWLDLPRAVVMRRLVARTARRAVRRAPSGNRFRGNECAGRWALAARLRHAADIGTLAPYLR
jgi:adenylate kinase family enzyme